MCGGGKGDDKSDGDDESDGDDKDEGKENDNSFEIIINTIDGTFYIIKYYKSVDIYAIKNTH